jgi:hypothetical protein
MNALSAVLRSGYRLWHVRYVYDAAFPIPTTYQTSAMCKETSLPMLQMFVHTCYVLLHD